MNLCLNEKNNAEGLMFIVNKDDKLWINVFFKIKIPKYNNIEKNYFDLETPYGYGGPISNSNDKNFLNEANNFFCEWIKSNFIVAELIRFNPILKNYSNYFDKNYYSDVKKTCSLNLRLVNSEYEPFKSKSKNMLRNSSKN